MRENKPSRTLLIILAIFAALLILFCAIFFVWKARGTPESGSLPSTSLPPATSIIPTSPAASGPATSVSDGETLYCEEEGARFATALPPGPYIPVDESNLGQLDGRWYYSPDLASTGAVGQVYDYWFDTTSQKIEIGQGPWQSEATILYHGTFTLQQPGTIVAQLEEAAWLPDDSSALATAQITINLKFSQTNPDIIVATITDVSSDSPHFKEQFDKIIGIDCPYCLQDDNP